MSKETKEMTKELRDVREEMILDDDLGPLYIPENLKREGYHRRIVDTSRGGRVEKFMRMGYSVVMADGARIGQADLTSVRSLDSAVRIHLGGSKEAQGILMECPQEIFDKRQLAKQKRVEEQTASLGHTGISTQTGEITIGNHSIK